MRYKNQKIILSVIVGSLLSVSAVSAKSFNIYNALNATQSYFSVNGLTGNVGIGTTNPGYGLDIETGSIKINNGITGVGQSGTIYLGDDSFTKAYGGSWTFSGGLTNNSGPLVTNFNNAGAAFSVTQSGGGPSAILMGGNVGVGLTNPTYKLDVSGTGNFTQPVIVGTPTAATHAATKSYVDGLMGSAVGAGTTGQTLRNNGTGWVANSTLFNNGTNVGIGRTNPTQRLHVEGVSATEAQFLNYEVGTPQIVLNHAGAGWGLIQNNAAGKWSLGYNATSTFDTLGTSVLTWTNGGNVGIANTNPVYKLDVTGTANFTQPVIVGTPTATTHATTKSYVDSLISGGTGSTVGYWTMNGTNISNSNSGNVGIGTTGTIKLGTTNKLWSNGPTLVGIVEDTASAATPLQQFAIGVSGQGGLSYNGAYNFYTSSGYGGAFKDKYKLSITAEDSSSGETSALLTLQGDGNVGIGTTVPISKLNVHSGTGDGATYDSIFSLSRKSSTGNIETGKIVMDDKDTNWANMIFKVKTTASAGEDDSFYTNAVTIDGQNANVGIGLTNPVYKLDVSGTGQFTQPVIVGTPTGTTHATTKSYVDGLIGGKLTAQRVQTAIDVNTLGDNFLLYGGSTGAWLNRGPIGNNADAILHIPTHPGDYYSDMWFDTANNRIYSRGVNAGTIGGWTLLPKVSSATANYITKWSAVDAITNSVMYDNGTNVGIGLTNPVYKLDVAGTGQFNQPVIVGTPTGATHATTKSYVDSLLAGGSGSTVGYWTMNGTNISSSNSGNVGIGTANPISKIQVLGTTEDNQVVGAGVTSAVEITNSYTAAFGRLSELIFSSSSGGGVNRMAAISSAYTNWDAAGLSGDLRFSTRSIGGASLSEKMRIMANGNVGIGTTNPVTMLDIAGKFRISNDAVVTWGGAADYGQITWDTGKAIVKGATGKALSLGANGSHDLLFINTSGNVGVANTNPVYKLDVSGTANFTQPVIVGTPTGSTHATTKSYVDSLLAGGSGSTVGYWSMNGANINNSNSGNVGIGTAAPSAKLDIIASADSIRITNDTYDQWVLQKRRSDNSQIMGIKEANSNGAMAFWTGSSEVMRIMNGGNVGVGITNPSAKLDVAGYFQVDSDNKKIKNGDMVSFSGIIQTASNWPTCTDPARIYTLGTINASSADSSFIEIEVVGSHRGYDLSSYIERKKYVIYVGDKLTSVTEESDGQSLVGLWNGTDGGGFNNATAAGQAIQLIVNPHCGSALTYSVNVRYSNSLNFTPSASGSRFSYVNHSSYTASIPSPSLHLWNNSVGIGLTNPSYKLDVAGTGQFNQPVLVGTPTANGHAVTKSYVDSLLGAGSYLPLTGGALTGGLNMGGNNITNINKLTVTTIDPLYNIKGVNYSTFASAIAGGVKEEYVGKGRIASKNNQGEYELTIDFDNQEEGSDLWVWHKTVDFSDDNVQVLLTPSGKSAQVYYLISGNKLVLRADKAVTVSYRLIGRRLDWRNWPTKAADQQEKASFIIK